MVFLRQASLVVCCTLFVSSVNVSQRSYNLPVSLIKQGNRRHLAYSLIEDRFTACAERILDFQTWNGGGIFSILVKEIGDPAISDWSVELEFDSNISQFQAYDAQVTIKSSRKFLITPRLWNTNLSQTDKKILGGQLTWKRDSETPSFHSVTVNGQTYNCKPGLPSDSSNDDISTEESENNNNEVEEEGDKDCSYDCNHEKDPNGENTPEISVTSPAQTVDGDPVKRGVFVPWPKKVMGLYILLADDDHEGFESDVDWHPKLYKYQQEGANVLFFTFIHPGDSTKDMTVPPAFVNLAKTRGTNQPGAVPANTVIIFAIGGYAYSYKIKPWKWLTSKEAAEKMAEEVATWPKKYNCDGIDLDLEDGAGDVKGAGENMIHFIKKLREIEPKIIISQPTYGYPQVAAEIDVINESWDKDGKSKNMADSIGIMVYEGTNALNYVKNYVSGTDQWEGFPIKVNAPSNTILLGAKGSSSSNTLSTLVDNVIEKDYLGIMVWYASVENGLQYAKSWDASESEQSQRGYVDGLRRFKQLL